MKKVLITLRSFGKYNHEELMEKPLQHGVEPVLNPYGTIMSKQQMHSVFQDMDGLIVGAGPVSEEALRQIPRLRAVAKYGVGVDNIVCIYAQENDAAIGRTVNTSADMVTDYAMTPLMSVARHVVKIDEGCHHNDWSKKEAPDIYEKTINILGLGAIEKGVVQRVSGFDMRIHGYDIMRDGASLNKYNVCFTDVDTTIRERDFISLHLPLTQGTRYILSKENLKRAKSNLIVINTAEEGSLDKDALYELLKERKLYGLRLDVFEQELPQNSKLLTLLNTIVGSHTATSTREAINAIDRMAVENLIRSLEA